MNPINKDFVNVLMAMMPTPEEADAMGIYNDVVKGEEVFSYKGEYLGTVKEISDKKWFKDMWRKVESGEMSEFELERLCEERG